MTTTTDLGRARREIVLGEMGWAQASPGCECRHRQPDGPDIGCGDTACFRVSVICAEEGCDCAAAVYLLCAECAHVWQRRSRSDPSAPRLRVVPL